LATEIRAGLRWSVWRMACRNRDAGTGEPDVIPPYGQIVVQAEGATQVPVPETGEERVVTSAEQDRDVLIEVCDGYDRPELGEQVFDRRAVLHEAAAGLRDSPGK
jgi:hypothetical protein